MSEATALEKIERVRAKPLRFRDEQITMAHGAGGKATLGLIEGLLAPAFGIPELADAAAVGELAVTTDSFVVKPLRFPGGSIGELAVNGTVNDLAVAGAQPLALTLSLVLEEGLATDVLRAEVEAIARAAEEAGVEVVAGDTKVVERGRCDGMYVTTTGIGRLDPRGRLSPASLQPGDRILVSGPVGAHGVAMVLEEGEVPVDPAVAGAAEILGIDPMYVANEGKLVAFVAPEGSARALAALQALDPAAAEIGEVKSEPSGMVLVETGFGGRRVMDQLVGDPLPRIC